MNVLDSVGVGNGFESQSRLLVLNGNQESVVGDMCGKPVCCCNAKTEMAVVVRMVFRTKSMGIDGRCVLYLKMRSLCAKTIEDNGLCCKGDWRRGRKKSSMGY